jgi:hypothetical protein
MHVTSESATDGWMESLIQAHTTLRIQTGYVASIADQVNKTQEWM